MQDLLIVEQAQLCARYIEVEQDISNAYQNIFNNTTRLTPVEQDKWLGQTLVQLQDNNLLLQAQVQSTTSSEQVVERKTSIEEIATQFDTMEQEAKTIMEATT